MHDDFLVLIELQDKRVEFKGKTMTDDGKSRPDFLMLALLFKVSSTENTIRLSEAILFLFGNYRLIQYLGLSFLDQFKCVFICFISFKR